ncbi:uncharacterized protein BDZ99DRAFT_475616 [Mytilinidion resinicola]|uniref:Serine/arginine repetitive matrix protein 1 n=1 Tax=Mytilinidion resinicola TaxID=574789 RepID=A0A6A6YPB5_9PEZI|nr:uncharacterized protein BDZ99DRAFT_475616 [Mytilinidion resinicola]KAF2810722.1 hypothetical protein BDZ99DRAFT_475616 [Mytilinidion resinicola]
MDRDRDPRDDRYTYRPGRSPPPRDSYRARSPPRRPLPVADTYVPGNRPARPRSRSPGFRRRSRSPPRGESWRARPRSPMRRAYSPRRDDYRNDTRARSPPRREYESYRRSPRPVRERSPLPLKRPRDISPARSRGMRSPPPAKRERIESPPARGRYDEPRSRAATYVDFDAVKPAEGRTWLPTNPPDTDLPFRPPRRAYSPPPRDNRDYRRRSPSPRREPRADPYAADTWRRRSPSPVRQAYPTNDASGRGSAATSRRSSPPVHQSRVALVPDEPRGRPEPISPAPRSPYRSVESEPVRERRSPPTGPREREFSNGVPPTGPAFRNGDGFSRAPPTGPAPNRPASRNYGPPAMTPPMGPSSNSMSTGPRAHNPVLAPPMRPRGGGGRGGYAGDYAPREYGGGPPPARRGSGHWAGGRGGPGGAPYYPNSGPPSGPPAGPRGGGVVGGPQPFAPPFRGSSNSTSTTYPRTQRFQNHLADLPKIVDGGKLAPELFDKSKLSKLEEEARKLRELIEIKQAKKRQTLREWETGERECDNNTLRAELAEQHLKSLNGENDVGGAAF